MENNTLEITEFFSVCSQIVLRAGNIIREVFNAEGGFIPKTKNGDEPFTEADVKVQTLIVKGLRTFWPNIKIIGEEEEVFEKDLGFDFKELRRDLVSKDLFKDIKSTQIDLNNAIVWVDPLDGTVEFIRGALDCVTTLIGISVGKEAKVGVVGRYFVEAEGGKYSWEPKCYFGHADYPHLFCVDYLKESKFEEIAPPQRANPDKLNVLTTRNHWSPELEGKIAKLNADSVTKVGGAGNKALAVIHDRGDCSFYPKPGMKNWDICACEAILRSIGGVVSDANNDPLYYGGEPGTWACEKGVIMTISAERHKSIMNDFLNK